MAIGRITGQMLSANLARSGTDLTFETNLLALDVTNSRVGIGTATPGTTLHVSATDALRLPSGTTGQRPGSPANGDIRYNTTTATIEGYSNGAYANLASGTELKDADGDTSVNVEPSSDADEVHINTANSETAIFRTASTDLGVTNISNTASTITGLVTNGDITLTPNGTGSVKIDKADINGGAIDGVTIGSNSAATALTVSGGTVAITDTGGDGTMDGVIIGGSTAAAGSFTTLSASSNLTVSGNTTVTGNLTVNGTTTTIDSTTLTIEDPLIQLAKNNSGGDANTFDQGLFFNRGSLNNVSFLWDESADQFAFARTASEDGTTAGNVTIDSYEGIRAGVGTFTDVETAQISAADGTTAATIANSTGVVTVPSAVLTTADINAGTVDNVTIGGSTAGAGTFTTLIAANTQTGTVKANDGTAAIAIADSTGAVTITTAVELDGGNVTINESSASVDFRVESNGHAHALFVDGSEDHVGIKTASPAYDLDISGSTDAVKLPSGTTAQRPTASAGIIRFNSQTGFYEGCQDGSTFINFAVAGSAPTFTKETATGDGSTTTFTGFFSSAPENVNNVFVYIDNVFQEPTENYTVSGTNITFTSAPHSAARIFAITGADGTSLVTGGVARSETSSVSFTSTATTIMSFNAATYRSAELFITLTDSGNSEYSAQKGVVVHNGSTAFITVHAITNTGDTDLATITAEHDGSNTVNVKAQSTGGTTAARVQYSLSV